VGEAETEVGHGAFCHTDVGSGSDAGLLGELCHHGAPGQGACATFPVAVVFIRSLVVVILTAILIRRRRVPLRVNHVKVLLIRSATGFAALVLIYWALDAVPLATAVTLQYMYPLFVALFSGSPLASACPPRRPRVSPRRFSAPR